LKFVSIIYYLFQVSLIKTETRASNIFDKIKNYTRPVDNEKEPQNNLAKNIELPPIVTASDLIKAQVENKIPEPKIKRGIKRDHLTQQSMKSYCYSTNSTSLTENEEYITKKPKIANTESDMEISSDDDVQIIETTNIDNLQQMGSSKIEELQPQEKIIDSPNRRAVYYQTMSTNAQSPKIAWVPTQLKNNYESCTTYTNSLNTESDYGVNNMLPIPHQGRITIHATNNTCMNSVQNINSQENGISHSQSRNNRSLTPEKNITDIFNELSDILETSSDSIKTAMKQPDEPLHQKQKDFKQQLVEHRLSSVQQNIEVSSSKDSINGNFGDHSDDESKVSSADVKKKSLGVRLGLPSNVNSTFKTNKKSHEFTKAIKNKTDEQNNKQKKFELSNLVVKLLNPYYKNNIFNTKELFKFMAREIVHKLLESNSYPGKIMYSNYF